MNAARNIMKQMDPVTEQIGSNTFYIYPFPALKSANLSGDIISLLMPLVTSLVPALGKSENLMDMDINDVAPHLGGAFSTLSGDRVEELLRKLILAGNVGILPNGEATPQWLNESLANEVFCMNAQDMFVLAFYVIKVNYAGFFEKLGNLFGNQTVADLMGQKFPGMAASMNPGSAI